MNPGLRGLEEPPFHLLRESLGLTVREVAALLRISRHSAAAYDRGKRDARDATLREMEDWVRRIEEVAQAFRFTASRIAGADLPPLLYKAARRRILEINAVDPRRPKRASPKPGPAQ